MATDNIGVLSVILSHGFIKMMSSSIKIYYITVGYTRPFGTRKVIDLFDPSKVKFNEIKPQKDVI